jgi:putative tryptophan/tyrosine transport system substrate-binding protein
VGVLVQQGMGYDETPLREAARLLQLQLYIAPEVRGPQDIEPAFAALRSAGVQMCFVAGGNLIYAHRQQVAELELRHRIPSMHFSADYVRAGGLISYGTDLVAQFRRSAYFIARILNGAKPADLPVEQPARFEMAVNLATARSLGLNIPQSMRLRADVVIE